MIKKLLLFGSVFLLTSCGSKSKLTQDTSKKQNILEEIETRKLSGVEINKDTLNERNDWVWQPKDPCSTEPVQIIQPDGSKILIPVEGHLRHDKQSIHSNTKEKQEVAVVGKKTIATKTSEDKRGKTVERTPFKMPWWIKISIWIGIIIGGLLYWKWKYK